jgi:hypothetical protein
MNYHAYSYDIARIEHGSRMRSGELRGVAPARLRDRNRLRKRSSPDASSS